MLYVLVDRQHRHAMANLNEIAERLRPNALRGAVSGVISSGCFASSRLSSSNSRSYSRSEISGDASVCTCDHGSESCFAARPPAAQGNSWRRLSKLSGVVSCVTRFCSTSTLQPINVLSTVADVTRPKAKERRRLLECLAKLKHSKTFS